MLILASEGHLYISAATAELLRNSCSVSHQRLSLFFLLISISHQHICNIIRLRYRRLCLFVCLCVCARVLPSERVYTRAAAFAYMHKELQIESSGVFARLSVELLMEFTAPPVTLEKCWRRQETNGPDGRAGRALQANVEGGESNLNGSIISSLCDVCARANKMLFILKFFCFFKSGSSAAWSREMCVGDIFEVQEINIW